MAWNTPLGPASSVGCRATAWRGDENPDTGLGGHVWIGCMMNQMIYVLDGDTGTVIDEANVPIGHYGGAMDGNVLDQAGVKTVASMPSREELIASIVGCIGAPAANIAGAIGAPASNIASILSTIEEKAA